MTFPQGGTEFGGYPGLVQPAPHDPEDVASEQLSALYGTDPGVETSSPEGVIAQRRRDGRARLGK
jgi:hypothetical protein